MTPPVERTRGNRRPAAEPFAQQGLHGAGEIQQSDEDKGQHVGWNREGQHQRPVQPAPTGEFAEAGEPGQADAQQRYADTDAEHQRQGVAQQAWHLGVPEVGPDLMIDGLPGEQQNAQWQQDQRSDGEDQGIPAALGGVGQGKLSGNIMRNRRRERKRSQPRFRRQLLQGVHRPNVGAVSTRLRSA